MSNIVTSPKLLWQECVKLAQNSEVTTSILDEFTSDHLLIAYGPVAQRNKFQSLLYSSKQNYNISILPIHNLDLFAKIPWPGRVACHIHWIHDKTKNARNESEATIAVEEWRCLLRRIKENGHMILWTVHNILPHNTKWISQDIEISQMIANAADYIHIMASDTIALAEPYYKINEAKTFVAPHPIYHKVNQADLCRPEARNYLQIEEDDFVFLCFGSILKYKGYDLLMNAYDQLRNKTAKKVRLVIAGIPSDKQLVSTIAAWGANKRDVILDMTTVPDDKLQAYFIASDIAVCPYHQTMNSGVAMMAMTFGLPIIGPKAGIFADLIESGCGFAFDPRVISSLSEAMEVATYAKLSHTKDKITKVCKNLAPGLVSSMFFDCIIKKSRAFFI